MSPTLAEGLVLVVIFVVVVWMGYTMLPSIARWFYHSSEKVKQVSRETERELRGDNETKQKEGAQDDGPKQQG